MNFYVVCFDISCDRARYRVSKLLNKYGSRVQHSVFEIKLKSGIESLMEEAKALIDESDKIHWYRQCMACRKKSCDAEGKPVSVTPSVIVV